MQDHHFDELREALGAQKGEGFEEKLQNQLGDKAGDMDDDEIERREREYYRSLLEPKYVIVKDHGRYRFRARYTDMHRSILSQKEIMNHVCDGGGYWGVDGENKRVTLYDSSSDFGRPKHIEQAIRQDGLHLLEILGKVCDKSGEEHDLSDYDITYIDAIGNRHMVNPMTEDELAELEERAKRDERDTPETRTVIHVGDICYHKHACNQQPKDYAKKKKAKRRQQKQGRKNRRI
jgi:hypothetical protein